MDLLGTNVSSLEVAVGYTLVVSGRFTFIRRILSRIYVNLFKV